MMPNPIVVILSAGPLIVVAAVLRMIREALRVLMEAGKEVRRWYLYQSWLERIEQACAAQPGNWESY